MNKNLDSSNKRTIDFYKGENKDDNYQLDGQGQFVKKMKRKLKYNYIPLSNDRLEELERLYFNELQFNSEFLDLLE